MKAKLSLAYLITTVASARRLTQSFALLAASLAAMLLAPSVRAEAAAGSITGSVSNTATGNLLEGAKIEITQLGLSTLTDNTGRFVLSAVPTGTHELIVSYIGLDTVRRSVTVSGGQHAVADFDLTTKLYTLGAYKVTGEREGAAAAITAERAAPNVKNVVAMDSFGNLPNMSVGEVIKRLPGVAGDPSDEGLAYGFSIRGTAPELNTVTLDGTRLTTAGDSRAFEMSSLTGAMFEEVEVIKGHTPDQSADSLGGTVNLKTKSPLNLKEKRRFTYNFSARVAPAFTQQIPLREQHRSHPLLNLGYQEVFDIFGGHRNLGISVNLFYSELAVGFFQTNREFQNTTSQPAYLWSYRTMDHYNNRKQESVNVKADYRLSPNTKLSVNFIGNNTFEPSSRIRYYTTAYGQNQNAVPNATTSSVVPGFTDRITEIRAVPTSIIDSQTVGPNQYMARLRALSLNAEQEFGPLKLDYTADYSYTHLNNGQGEGASLIMRLPNVGWILDRTQSDLYPRFTQTAGPDFTNPANYRPAPNGLTHADGHNANRLRDLRGNARYVLPTKVSTILKAGVEWRETMAQVISANRQRWSYIGTDPLPADHTLISFDEIKTGRHTPQWEATSFYSHRTLVDPSLWKEDLYFNESAKYSASRSELETVTAGYLMAEGKFGNDGLLGRTGYLAGVRIERTDTEGSGWVRARTLSTPAQQLADPVGSALLDYGDNYRQTKGGYTNSFPSVHLTHDITPNLKGRLSWSTSFGRPPMINMAPGETPTEKDQTLRINNPSLLPETATNWDAALDYYFEPVGNISVGWFHKKIDDFIIANMNTGKVAAGNDNGYNGEYENFTILQSTNGGTAYVQGWELSYQQQFTFLPDILRGISFSANYTALQTHGDFGGTANLSGGQVEGFIPQTMNLMLSWRYRAFSTRVLYNRTSDHIVEYSPASVGLNTYRQAMEMVNFGVAYQIRPSVSLTCDVSNLLNTPQVLYRGVRSQMQTTIINGTTINFGVTGQF